MRKRDGREGFEGMREPSYLEVGSQGGVVDRQNGSDKGKRASFFLGRSGMRKVLIGKKYKEWGRGWGAGVAAGVLTYGYVDWSAGVGRL